MKVSEKFKQQMARQGAFAFIDLVVTLAVIGLVGVMILPALARSSASGATAQCLNNFRQLGAAWAMYSNDSIGDLIECHPWTMGSSGTRQAGTANPFSWAPGYAGLEGSTAYGPYPLHSSTNPVGLTKSVFYKYYNNVDLLKCPDDTRMMGGTAGNNPVVRSYSMNNWMNGGKVDDYGRLYNNQNQIIRPSATWVMIEEDEITLDDSYFVTFMDNRGFVNIPARRHNFGYAMNFADGRSEIYKFRDSANMYYNGGKPGGGTPIPNSGNSSDYMLHTNRTTAVWGVWDN